MEKSLKKITWQSIIDEFIGSAGTPDRNSFVKEFDLFINELQEPERDTFKSVFLLNKIPDIKTYNEIKQISEDGLEMIFLGFGTTDKKLSYSIQYFFKILAQEFEKNNELI